ncbi:type II and III secretion system protein family protein [Paracoccus caeni]|uniref:type II and III secretion system protein family protein n=1 Tax=Paracoccus caeni TaxID=657651 RepID=UPI00190E1E61|nr:pilus assembly protein N-terminal domain-containing protein [Paracoccus caeni]
MTGFVAALIAGAFTTASDAQSTRIYLSEGDGRRIELPEDTATVYIANPMIADAQAISPTAIYLTGYTSGRTSVIITSENSDVSAEYEVEVMPASGGAEALLPSETGVRRKEGIAIISGEVNDIQGTRGVTASERSFGRQGVITRDETTYGGGTQISLRVRFVEASRSELRRMGVDLAALGASAGGPLRVVTGGNPTGFLGGAAANSPAIGGRITSGSFTIDTVINALEERGAVQILSEPTLTTVSGRRASFRAGGEIGYPINQGDGVISAAFRQYGVSIEFLPTLLPNGRIAMEVQPEVSFLNNDNQVSVDGFTVPGLSVRRADTTVEVGSGQTFMIAGLYEQFSENGRRGTPGMSGLFGRSNNVRQERELLIFITPYIAEASNVSAPPVARRPVRNTVGFITR